MALLGSMLPLSRDGLASCMLFSYNKQVSRIKEKVEEQSGVPPPQQRLIFAGRQMYVPLHPDSLYRPKS